MNKTVFFAFRGDPMCFIHVLLNALNMAEKGMKGNIIIEGDAVKLIPEMTKPGHFLNQLYSKVREKNLIIGACRACSTKLGVAAAIEEEGVELIGDMSGHPAMSDYIREGYTILTF
ncbi:MAG: DsrE family protein [Thermodesulfobacteriota bacterium]|nr:DsrE family protein [Thermodesulfobacteriota bacterium]